jgi:hypothetical protein
MGSGASVGPKEGDDGGSGGGRAGGGGGDYVVERITPTSLCLLVLQTHVATQQT